MQSHSAICAGEDLLVASADKPFRFPATFTFVVRSFTVLGEKHHLKALPGPDSCVAIHQALNAVNPSQPGEGTNSARCTQPLVRQKLAVVAADGIGKGLDPRFDISEIAAPYARGLLLEGNPQYAALAKDFRRRVGLQVHCCYNCGCYAERSSDWSCLMSECIMRTMLCLLLIK